MKKIFTCILATISCLTLHGQIPTYKFTSWSGSGAATAAGFSNDDNKTQNIHLPSDFPGMPTGSLSVTNVYLRGYPPSSISQDSVTYHNVTLSVGYTTDSFYNLNGYDTFYAGLTPVFSAATQSFTGMKTAGRWIKFPVSNFSYDRSRNLVVEILHGPEGGLNNYGGFNLMSTVNTTPVKRALQGRKDSIRVFGSAQYYLLDIGFDIATTGIEGISNIRSIGLFPNPSTDGHFVVSLEAQKQVRSLSITLSDATGKTMLRKQYGTVGKEFFREVDASTLAKGTYFVLINADGESISRQVTIQ